MSETLTIAEENYLKAIFKITERQSKSASTNSIAEILKTKAASVTDMLKKLSEKELIIYEKYQGAQLSESGKRLATQLIRKHRLWEVFLYEKLKFSWEDVHAIAEELEHINSAELITRLDNYLGNPRFDPHGDPIPTADGKFMLRNQMQLDEMMMHRTCAVVGVNHHETPFLQHLNQLGIKLGTELEIIEKSEFDQAIRIKVDRRNAVLMSHEVSRNVFVKLQ